MVRKNRNKHQDSYDRNSVVLLLQVPRTNDKKELAAEQMFAALHGLLLSPSAKLFRAAHHERISFEIAVLNRRIGFYVCVPNYLKDFVEEQVYAQYPSVQISEVEDYSRSGMATQTALTSELRLVANDALPIKTFQSFEVDPLAAITATLAKFEEGEEAWIQLVLTPASSNWHKKSERYVGGVRGKSRSTASGLLGALWQPPEHSAETVKLSEHEQARASSAEEKSHKLAFNTNVRIVYRGNVSTDQATLRLRSIVASYKQFNTNYMNGFEQGRYSADASLLADYRERKLGRRSYVLNIEEVATLYHLPHTNVETPSLLWALSQTAEPPANLPIVDGQYREDVSPVAATNFRGPNTMFGMPRIDRGRHLYLICQTGVGKSGLLELLPIHDIYRPYGFAGIDPLAGAESGVVGGSLWWWSKCLGGSI